MFCCITRIQELFWWRATTFSHLWVVASVLSVVSRILCGVRGRGVGWSKANGVKSASHLNVICFWTIRAWQFHRAPRCPIWSQNNELSRVLCVLHQPEEDWEVQGQKRYNKSNHLSLKHIFKSQHVNLKGAFLKLQISCLIWNHFLDLCHYRLCCAFSLNNGQKAVLS